MKSSAISKSVTKILVTVLCLSLLSPAVRATEHESTSKPPSEGSAASRESDGAKARTDDSRKNSPQPLSGDEVREISARAEEPGPEVAGGALSNLHLTYIVIALATAVIVILIAK